MEKEDELSPNQLFAEKLAINDEVGGDNLSAGTSSGTIQGQIVENAFDANYTTYEQGGDIPGFYEGPWFPGQEMNRDFDYGYRDEDLIQILFAQLEETKQSVNEAITKQPSIERMFNHIIRLAKEANYTDEGAEVFTYVYVHFMIEHNSFVPSEELNKMGSQIALNYIINYSASVGRHYEKEPINNFKWNPQIKEKALFSILDFDKTQLKENNPEESSHPQNQEEDSLTKETDQAKNEIEEAHQPEKEEVSVFEEEDYFTPIFTLPRDDELFGKWPFKYATVYGYRNDPKKPHDLFSVFEPHMIYKEFEQMEKMKLVKQAQSKPDIKTELVCPETSQVPPTTLSPSATIKTEQTDNNFQSGSVLPVQCDVIKPKYIKLIDGTTFVNGEQVKKYEIEEKKQKYQKLPAWMPKVTRTEIAVGERMAENNQESPFDPKPYWSTDASF
ncbi:Oidioi.mRNA.OKI2018_I69.PAR.g8899.t1.cds [Oikopleura dioica]|uniref:Oidioi.mRNA.OKI2018_I69.PAR.g8899.t1.cds n=1 Tax=Oikopleura dioica TaxID=34765 RepID=A0ABN7RLN5_OIKDI|nr:Oidioi.mRNA.OKI2018_I69.PAR.g8899.t1.cds [Oikopleura dioica]